MLWTVAENIWCLFSVTLINAGSNFASELDFSLLCFDGWYSRCTTVDALSRWLLNALKICLQSGLGTSLV